jgi:hypothetical protein
MPDTTLSLEQAAWYGPLPSSPQENGKQAEWNGPLPSSPQDNGKQAEKNGPPPSDDLSDSSPSPTQETKKRSYTYHARMPRAPDARRHRKSNHVELFSEMKNVFSRKFEASPDARILFKDLVNAFASSRMAKGKLFSDDEKKIFTRHSKRLFLIQWPNAEYRVVQEVVCYFHVGMKKE